VTRLALLPERVYDVKSIRSLCFLQIFGEKHPTASLFRRAQDESVPEPNAADGMIFKIEGEYQISESPSK
jgi:hypothetical protein